MFVSCPLSLPISLDSIPITFSDFGAGEGLILLSSLRCTGDEATIFDCRHMGLGFHYCSHDEDAGVVCKGTFTCTCEKLHFLMQFSMLQKLFPLI